MENQLESAALLLGQPSVMNTPQADRRRHPRYPCNGHAEVFIPHGALLFQGRILDLSLSGCFIETPALNLERGTHVEVYFIAHQMQFRIAGHITVLQGKRGAGVSFGNLSPRRACQLADLVRELKEMAELEENTLKRRTAP